MIGGRARSAAAAASVVGVEGRGSWRRLGRTVILLTPPRRPGNPCPSCDPSLDGKKGAVAVRPTRIALVISVLLITGACSSSGEPSVTTTGSPEISVSTVPDSSATSVVPSATTTTSATTTATVVPGNEPPWDVWTLVYASLDIDLHAREHAQTIAGDVAGGAVLLSDDYPSLNPGYWVVYSGEWGDRQQAGIWCPRPLPEELSCYPRYLGSSIPDLLNHGAALAQLDQGRLVALDPASGEILATFSDNVHWEAEFPSSFNLTAGSAVLYFGMGWEDSWFSCESDGGEVWRLDLDSGVEEVFSAGWSPSISPDGRWLAVVKAAECYPDPEVSGWVVSPGSQVEIYDLSDGDAVAEHVLRTAPQPTSYDDPQIVQSVMWDPANSDLLVSMGDGSVRRIAHDSQLTLTDAPIEFTSEVGSLAAVTADYKYLVEFDGESTFVSRLSRTGGDEVESFTIDAWVTGYAVGGNGDVIITTRDYLVLPSGERLPIEGGISNLAW